MEFNLDPIIATCVICGCQTMRNLIIVLTVDFVVSVERRTSNIATIVACASTKAYTQTTIARAANTNQTALSVRSSSLVLEVRLMKCLAAMLFTGSVFDSLLPTIRDALFARRPQRLVNA